MTEQQTFDSSIFRPGLLKDKVLDLVKPGLLIAVYDTETTGLYPEQGDRIIEFAGILWLVQEDYTLKWVNQTQIYIKPPTPVSQEIVELTGITNEFLADKPSEAEVVYAIRAFLKQADVAVGHNIPFDNRFVKTTMERNNRLNPIGNILDSLKMARDIVDQDMVENNKLETLVTALGLNDGVQFHSAIDDVGATSKLFEAMLQQYIAQDDNADVELITVKVESVSYWAKHDMERLYFNTDIGSVFLDLKSDYLGTKDKEIDATRINRAQLERDAMELIGVNTVEALLAFRGKK